MTKQADRVLDSLLSRHEDGVSQLHAVEEVKDNCGIKEESAKKYIRESNVVMTEATLQGDRMIVRSEDAGETVLHGDDEAIMMQEVGERTGQKFANLSILEDTGHPQIPTEHYSGYIQRQMGETGMALGSKIDIDLVTATIADPDFSTLLKGKHGVGKDKLALHICARTNRPAIRMTANDDPDFVDLLFGNYKPTGNGGFEFRKGMYTLAYEQGYTVILDEFNNLPGKVQTEMNMMLEGQTQAQITVPETNQIIKPHPEFKFIATQNPNEIGYGGRKALDQSTESRFFAIDLPPLDARSERKVVAGETQWDVEDPTLKKISKIVGGVRESYEMNRITKWPSTRHMIQIGRLAAMLDDPQAATEAVLLGHAHSEDKESIKSSLKESNW